MGARKTFSVKRLEKSSKAKRGVEKSFPSNEDVRACTLLLFLGLILPNQIQAFPSISDDCHLTVTQIICSTCFSRHLGKWRERPSVSSRLMCHPALHRLVGWLGEAPQVLKVRGCPGRVRCWCRPTHRNQAWPLTISGQHLICQEQEMSLLLIVQKSFLAN